MTAAPLGLLEFHDRFRPDASYDQWRDVLRQLSGRPPSNLEAWRHVSGGRALLLEPPSELFAAIGRGAAKSESAAIIALWKAVTYKKPRWFGQRPFVLIIAGQDQRQADETLNYARQLLDHPSLRPLVAGDLAKRVISLKNGVRIEVVPSEGAKLRGRGALCIVIDEAGFYPADDSADLLAAIRPALGRVPGSLLIAVSTKDRRKGFFFDAWKTYFGMDDPDVLVIDGDTLTFNPTFNRATIDRAFREDPVAALSEYGQDGRCGWRQDITSLITPEAIAAVTSEGVLERPPDSTISYRAFVDFAGGSGGDSAAVAIAHTDRASKREVLDAIREIPPPFSPASVCAEFATLLQRYGMSTATADRWGSMFVVEGMAAHGIRVEQSASPKSDIYLLALPLINSGLIDLLDDPKLARQATALERKVGGSVDHPPRQHDDRVNAAFGALVVGRQHAGLQYRVRVIGFEAPAETIDDCPIPRELRGDTDRVLAFLFAQEPAATLEDVESVWKGLVDVGVVPPWTPEIQRKAETLIAEREAA